MLAMIRDWFERMRKNSRDAEHMRGYEFAAGCLLLGDSVETLEARCYGSPADFDKGMEHAISDWLRHEDRIKAQELRRIYTLEEKEHDYG